MTPENGNRIEGHRIHLTKDEMRLFHADDPSPYVARVDAVRPMDHLATDMQRMNALRSTPAAWMNLATERLFDRRLERFLPVAGAILAHETEQFLVAHPRAEL